MTRITRDIPASCCCDSWKHGIRTIDGQYPDDNREFTIAAGDGIEINPITAGIEVAVRTPIPGPMVFRGTVGTSGTIATLPTANANNLGYTYVAITAGTTPDSTPKSYDVGDMLVSNGAEWTVIPSGDDPVAWSQITGTPTTLSGYGITDAVDTSTNQEIGGVKTFDDSPVINFPISSGSGGGGAYKEIVVKDNDGTQRANFRTQIGSGQTIVQMTGRKFDGSGAQSVSLQVPETSDAYVTAPVRTYNASNTSDVVTIGSLQDSTDVLHRVTTSVQNAGTVIDFVAYGSMPKPPLNSKATITLPQATGQSVWLMGMYDKDDNKMARLFIRVEPSGIAQLRAELRNSDGTFKTVTLASGDVI